MGKEGVGWGRLSVRSEWPFGGRRWQRGSLFSVFSRLTFHSASMGWLASNFQLTSWESGALTGRCLQNAKHLGGQGGGSYSLFIASKETGEISIKIQVLKFDCFPRRDSYIFCFVILFRVCLVDSILRRGLSCVSPSPPTSFPIQVSKIPHHTPAPTFRSLNLIWIGCGLWAAVDTGWLGDPCGFVSIWREWVGAFYNSSRTRQTVKKLESEGAESSTTSKHGLGKEIIRGSRVGEGRAQEKKGGGIKPNFAGNSNKSSNCWQKKKKKIRFRGRAGSGPDETLGLLPMPETGAGSLPLFTSWLNV